MTTPEVTTMGTASTEPTFLGGLPEDRITVNAEHEIVERTTGTSRLTEDDRFLITSARHLTESVLDSPASRALAREVLRQLADLAERLGGAR